MSFLRQFFIYGVWPGAASRLAAVVLVPLYTRTLSISDYGQLELVLAVYGVVVIFAGMQVESAVARDYFEAKESGRLQAIASCACYLAFLGTAALGLALTAAWRFGWLPDYLDGQTVALLIGLTLPTQLFGVQLVFVRFSSNPVRFALLSFLDLAMCAGFSAVYIVCFDLGVGGALLGILTAKLICVALSWSSSFGSALGERPQRIVARSLLAYGIPSMPAVLVGWVQNAGSRLLLAISLPLSAVAIAGVSIKVAAIYGFIIYSFRLAWEPFSIAKLGVVQSDPHVYNRALEWFVLTMFFCCGIGALLGPYAVRVLAPAEYASGGRIALFFLLGQFWTGITNVLVIGIHGARRTAQLLPVYGYGAAVNAALLLILSPSFGVPGAGLASLAGSICSAFVALHYSNSHLGTKFNTRLLLWSLFSTIAFAAVWYPVAERLRTAQASLGPAVELAASGLCLILALLAIIVWQSFEPGRFTQMCSLVNGYTRRGRPSS